MSKDLNVAFNGSILYVAYFSWSFPKPITEMQCNSNRLQIIQKVFGDEGLARGGGRRCPRPKSVLCNVIAQTQLTAIHNHFECNSNAKSRYANEPQAKAELVVVVAVVVELLPHEN